jgi:hypothetical protein
LIERTLNGGSEKPTPDENLIVSKILQKAGMPNLLSDLDLNFSMSELNTLLLELFRMKTSETKAAEILRQYAQNRFAKPAKINSALYHRVSAELFEYAEKSGYTALELSPASVLGTCSAIAAVDQNKVISALRSTEILSDATNALTLHAAFVKSNIGFEKSERLRYCAIHRHIRAQKFQGANTLPHFALYSMIISGVDEGNFTFEKEALRETFMFYHQYLSGEWKLKNLKFIILQRAGRPADFSQRLIDFLHSENSQHLNAEIRQDSAEQNNYYQGLQFKIKADYEGKEIEIGDGGFVDWTAKLLQNKKERLLISGIGLERLLNMRNN